MVNMLVQEQEDVLVIKYNQWGSVQTDGNKRKLDVIVLLTVKCSVYIVHLVTATYYEIMHSSVIVI